VQSTQQEAVEELKRRGRALQTAPREPIDFAKDARANELLNDLDRHPHAFVLACLMDRQYPAYKCWRIPTLVRDALGTFEVSRLARVSRGRYQRIFAGPPALHHLREEMAEIFAAALGASGIQVTALHSHMLSESPRLFFMHFWANANAVTLGRGLRAALREMRVESH
jgi:endonuclease-3